MTPTRRSHAGPPPCPTVAARAYELLDGELDRPLASVVREHLCVCAPCRAFVARADALRGLVARASHVEPAPAALAARVHEELLSAERSLAARSCEAPPDAPVLRRSRGSGRRRALGPRRP